MPYSTAFRLAEEYAPDKLVDENAARRVIAKWKALHPTNVMEKTALIIEHFVRNVAPLLDGQAKAMIITPSRPAVIRYKYAFEPILNWTAAGSSRICNSRCPASRWWRSPTRSRAPSAWSRRTNTSRTTRSRRSTRTTTTPSRT